MRLEAPSLRDLRRIRHGFFGRRGGVSEGPWASLNVGLRGGDRVDAITTNRARVAAELGVPADRLVTARQVHGVTAIEVAEPWDNWSAPEADALVTNRPGLLLGVLTADCGPVLLADPEAGVIAAAHAGWKGALAGVLGEVVAAMAGLGARADRITAALGPCIGARSYEVGPEFRERFVAHDPGFRRHFDERSGRPHFDLRGFIGERLRAAGVGRVELLDHDTCAEDELFFSFRRSTLRCQERFGLQLSGIVLESRRQLSGRRGMARRAKAAEAAAPVERLLSLDPDPASRAGRRPYAVIDLGSNSVRVVVYDELGRAPLPRFNEKSMCSLGEGLAETGAIAPENFQRGVEAVRRFRAIAEAMGAARIDITATEAVRSASNGPDFVAAVAAHAGLQIRVLSGDEEAHFAAQGVISGLFRPVGLVGDMGGGSLEMAETLDDRVGDNTVSLPLGALPVLSLLRGGDQAAKARIDALLRENLPPVLTEPVFYAVGGGFRALAKAHLWAVGSPVRVVHGYSVPADEIRAFAKQLWHLSPEKLARMPGVASRRVPTLPSAAVVMERLIKHLGPERIVFSALGLREGWLYAQLPTAERYLDPLVEGARLFGLHLARVPAFAAALARWTERLFPGEVAADKRLRLAVCALSDIAWRDHPDVRAEESFRRLLQFPFIGLDHAERVFIALAIHARYAGQLDDRWVRAAVSLLSPSMRRRAMILGRVILLGYRFSGGVPEILADARLHVGADIVRLEVGTAGRVPDSEVVGDRLRLLADAIGVRRTEVVQRS